MKTDETITAIRIDEPANEEEWDRVGRLCELLNDVNMKYAERSSRNEIKESKKS